MKKKKNIKNDNEEIKFYSKEIKREKMLSDDLKVAKSFIIVLIVVILVLGGLFVMNSLYISKDNFQGNTTETTTTAIYDQYKILADSVFNIKENEYYVLFYNSDDPINYGLYNTIIAGYDKEDHNNINLYSVDLASTMNKDHYDETSEQDVNNLKFNTETLITIKNGKITSSETDASKINDILK